MARISGTELLALLQQEARKLHECDCACQLCGAPLSDPEPIPPSEPVGGGYDYEDARKDGGELDDDLIVVEPDPIDSTFAMANAIPHLPIVREEPPAFADYDNDHEALGGGYEAGHVPAELSIDDPYAYDPEPEYGMDLALDDLYDAISQALGSVEALPENDEDEIEGDLMFDYDMDESDTDEWNFSKGMGDGRAHIAREEELRSGPGRTTGYTHGDPASAQDQGWGNTDALPEASSAEEWDIDESYGVYITGFEDKFEAFRHLIGMGFGGNIANEVADMAPNMDGGVFLGVFSGEKMEDLVNRLRDGLMTFEIEPEGEYWADLQMGRQEPMDEYDEDFGSGDPNHLDPMKYEQAADRAAQALRDIGLNVDDGYAHQGWLRISAGPPVTTVRRVVEEVVPNWVSVDGDPVFVGYWGDGSKDIMVQF